MEFFPIFMIIFSPSVYLSLSLSLFGSWNEVKHSLLCSRIFIDFLSNIWASSTFYIKQCSQTAFLSAYNVEKFDSRKTSSKLCFAGWKEKKTAKQFHYTMHDFIQLLGGSKRKNLFLFSSPVLSSFKCAFKLSSISENQTRNWLGCIKLFD